MDYSVAATNLIVELLDLLGEVLGLVPGAPPVAGVLVAAGPGPSVRELDELSVRRSVHRQRLPPLLPDVAGTTIACLFPAIFRLFLVELDRTVQRLT